ncbi:MAG TPA: hypothetical protein VFQ61_19630 [Polyangiaceae bacterium]|nr:hypothetical protein [Polyangiaceae bacterium]
MGQATNDFKNRKRLFISGESRAVRRCADVIDAWIWWSYVGRAILSEILDAPAGRTVDFSVVPDNFIAGLDARASARSPNDAYGAGYSSPDLGITGTGMGSKVSVVLTNSLSVSDGTCQAIMNVPCSSLAAFKTHFVLMHEIVHANRIARGKLRTVSMGGRLKNSEEAIAIIVTNMLMSEKGESGLRKTYDTSDVLTITADEFVKQDGVESLVRTIANDHPRLKTTLNRKEIPVPFNPIYSVFQGAP